MVDITRNKSKLKFLYREAAVLEIIEQTKACNLIWKEESPNVYKTTSNADGVDYVLTLSRPSGYFDLEVVQISDARVILKASSILDMNIPRLYWTVDKLSDNYSLRKKRKILDNLGTIERCKSLFVELGTGGVVTGGSAIDVKAPKLVFKGGVVVGTSFVHRRVNRITARGGVIVGSCREPISAGELMSGKVVVGGSAPITHYALHPPING